MVLYDVGTRVEMKDTDGKTALPLIGKGQVKKWFKEISFLILTAIKTERNWNSDFRKVFIC